MTKVVDYYLTPRRFRPGFRKHVRTRSMFAIYGAFGFGFYLLHGSIQVHVTDLSSTARGAAASLHSSCFYMGQALGPVVYGYGFAHGGDQVTMLAGAGLVLLVGLVCAHLLRHRRPVRPE